MARDREAVPRDRPRFAERAEINRFLGVVSPLGRPDLFRAKVIPRSHQEILQVTLGGQSTNAGKFEISNAGRVIDAIVLSRDADIGGEAPSGSKVKTIQAEIAAGMRPAATQLKALSGQISWHSQEPDDDGKNRQKTNP